MSRKNFGAEMSVKQRACSIAGLASGVARRRKKHIALKLKLEGR